MMSRSCCNYWFGMPCHSSDMPGGNRSNNRQYTAKIFQSAVLMDAPPCGENRRASAASPWLALPQNSANGDNCGCWLARVLTTFSCFQHCSSFFLSVNHAKLGKTSKSLRKRLAFRRRKRTRAQILWLCRAAVRGWMVLKRSSHEPFCSHQSHIKSHFAGFSQTIDI